MTTFSASEFTLSATGYTNVVYTPQYLIAHATSGLTLIPRSAIHALTVSSHKQLLVLHLSGSQRIDLFVSRGICEAVAEWFFGQPVPPPEITSLGQTAFEAAYEEYLRVQAL